MLKPNPTFGHGTVYGKPMGVMMPVNSKQSDGTPIDNPVCPRLSADTEPGTKLAWGENAKYSHETSDGGIPFV